MLIRPHQKAKAAGPLGEAFSEREEALGEVPEAFQVQGP